MADERLIKKLVGATRIVHSVRWPDSELSVGLVIPTCQELQEAFVAARKYISGNLQLSLEAAVNSAVLQEEEEIQVLSLVVLDVVGGDVATPEKVRLFKGPSEVRSKLSTDQRLYLVSHLNKIQEAAAEGWGWPHDGDSRERMAIALEMELGSSLSAIADRVVELHKADK